MVLSIYLYTRYRYGTCNIPGTNPSGLRLTEGHGGLLLGVGVGGGVFSYSTSIPIPRKSLRFWMKEQQVHSIILKHNFPKVLRFNSIKRFKLTRQKSANFHIFLRVWELSFMTNNKRAKIYSLRPISALHGTCSSSSIL
jgi:hypothetical protein